jgi:hypothetical protein
LLETRCKLTDVGLSSPLRFNPGGGWEAERITGI